MGEWIRETSFRLVATQGNLILQCNCRGKILEVQKVESKFNIKYFTNERRISYENGKLFDFHGLTVLKGEQASSQMIETLSSMVSEVEEDLSAVSREAGIPVTVALTSIQDVGKLYLDERRYLDFSTTYLEYDLGREYLKDRPGFASERRFRLTLHLQGQGLKTVHWLESGRGEIYASPDITNWGSDIQEFRRIMGGFRPTSQAFQEIREYMSAFVSQ
ncbi:hypothetical protein [Metallosphaera javensis (ex Sakai et al. 2022)]|uniref:hypothetical protein n=1 Tax=Metallosphaera javensis (ex Sakai et al. 2022) TaxID=2775498 RepID=UPI00258A7EC7|nr:MAG: hypothetical protein MjAS7_1563 [Metallosphaera javensis (ex Sakai et al. 2022)]